VTCERLALPDGGWAIACGRSQSRIVCDICDAPHDGKGKERLRDGTEFDPCAACRFRIRLIRRAREAGRAIEFEWCRDAERKIRNSLAGVRG
jgi:hypothetical protein